MYNLLHLSFLAYKTPYSVFRNASFLNRCILNSILCGLNYNFLRGEEEEKGEGGRGEKKEEENWKQSEGRMENVSSIYFSLKIPGEFRKCVVINSRHFSKKLLTTEPFSPLRHRSRWFNSVCLFPYIPHPGWFFDLSHSIPSKFRGNWKCFQFAIRSPIKIERVYHPRRSCLLRIARRVTCNRSNLCIILWPMDSNR